MMRILTVLSFGFIAASLPQIAAAQSATLAPGLYDVSAEVTFAGQPFGGDETEVCVREGENDKTLEDLISGTNHELKCPPRNVVWTESTARADYTCETDKSGIVMGGTIEAQYGPEFLNFTMNGTLNETLEVKTDFAMRRKSECPADWIDPDPLGLPK